MHRTTEPFVATRMRPTKLVDDTSSIFFPAPIALRRAAFAANFRWRWVASAIAKLLPFLAPTSRTITRKRNRLCPREEGGGRLLAIRLRCRCL